nr:IS256 family transposase [Streptomyces yunnanensis]
MTCVNALSAVSRSGPLIQPEVPGKSQRTPTRSAPPGVTAAVRRPLPRRSGSAVEKGLQGVHGQAGAGGRWQNRPLDAIWPIIYIDALWVKIWSGSVVSKPVYLAVGVDTDGRKDVLGLWVGDEGEGATTWMTVLTELRNRGVEDVCIVACDGLKGLPEAVTATWPKATVQTCVIHLIRASLRLAAKQHHAKLIPELKAIYTAPTEQTAEQALADFTASEWGQRYPAIVRTWQSPWSEFTPYLAFPPEVRRVVYSTNLIESINARLRKVTRNRGHSPSE